MFSLPWYATSGTSHSYGLSQCELFTRHKHTPCSAARPVHSRVHSHTVHAHSRVHSHTSSLTYTLTHRSLCPNFSNFSLIQLKPYRTLLNRHNMKGLSINQWIWLKESGQLQNSPVTPPQSSFSPFLYPTPPPPPFTAQSTCTSLRRTEHGCTDGKGIYTLN